MKDKHFIFDFETLGTDLLKGFPVLECAYGIFDADRFLTDPYTFEELVESVIVKDKLKVAPQVEDFGHKIDPNTLAWWKRQGPKLVNEIVKPSKHDISVEKFIDNVMNMLYSNPRVQYWWSRSNTFDPIILYRLCTDVNRMDELSNRLKHWNVRDTRTYIDAKFNFAPKMTSFILEEWQEKFEAHNSIHDVAIDVMRLQKLIITENE